MNRVHIQFEEIEPTADWADRVRGESLAQLFIQLPSGFPLAC